MGYVCFGHAHQWARNTTYLQANIVWTDGADIKCSLRFLHKWGILRFKRNVVSPTNGGKLSDVPHSWGSGENLSPPNRGCKNFLTLFFIHEEWNASQI